MSVTSPEDSIFYEASACLSLSLSLPCVSLSDCGQCLLKDRSSPSSTHWRCCRSDTLSAVGNVPRTVYGNGKWPPSHVPEMSHSSLHLFLVISVCFCSVRRFQTSSKSVTSIRTGAAVEIKGYAERRAATFPGCRFLLFFCF